MALELLLVALSLQGVPMAIRFPLWQLPWYDSSTVGVMWAAVTAQRWTLAAASTTYFQCAFASRSQYDCSD
jgi:hypothetical protein